MFDEMMPLTFCLQLDVSKTGQLDMRSLHREMKQFESAYNQLKSLKKTDCSFNIIKLDDGMFKLDQNKPKIEQVVVPPSHFFGKNLWILKPVNLNRGQGIHVVQSIEETRQTIIEEFNDQRPKISSQNVLKSTDL